MRLRCADALEFPWTSHDLVFVSLTCFTEEMVARVAARAEELTIGARIIVTSRPLESACLRLLRRERLCYGKGMMTFIAYERVS